MSLGLLLVEEDDLLARAMVRFLRKRYEVHRVQAVSEAQSLLRAGALYDLLVCDADGALEPVLAFLRSCETEQAALLRFVFGGGLFGARAAKLSVHSDQLFHAPFSMDELDRSVERIRRSRA